MENTLRSHLIFLNHRLQELADTFTRPIKPGERDAIEAQVQLAREALEHYRRAFEIEYAIRNDSPDTDNVHQE